MERIASEAWLGLGDTSVLPVYNPILSRTPEDIEDPIGHLLKIIVDPEWFSFTCKHIFNVDCSPTQLVILQQLWKHPFPMLLASRGAGKSFMLGLYALLRAFIDQGSKVVIVGSGFRQAKGVIEYSEKIWANAPILRDLVGEGVKRGYNGIHKYADSWVLRLGESTITALPLGTGEKIRGVRSTHLLVDEFASINPEIFEVVVRGFGAVSASPVERMKQFAKFRALQELGLEPENAQPNVGSNQTVISGTAYYQFNHFFRYWKKHKSIIESRGEKKKLEEIFGEDIPKGFDSRDYCVIRIPIELIPEGFMDEKSIAASRASMHSSNYALEYGCCFSADSNGFFKRSLIESCVSGNGSLPEFSSLLSGRRGFKYAMGIDPAAEADNFAVVILELHPDHRRIVYCWTTNREDFKAKEKRGITKEKDFYYYAANKIRELHLLFPCAVIGIDSQGGGNQIIEALANVDSIPGELANQGLGAMLPWIEEDDPKDTDDMRGEHILRPVQFASAEWVSEANHGMKMDFESKKLLFPSFDDALLAIAMEEDKLRKSFEDGSYTSLYDTMESCMLELEEAKDEIASIVHSRTSVAGRDHWDTPEIKTQTGKKGRMRKDRYSALLIANMEARVLERVPEVIGYDSIGSFAGSDFSKKAKSNEYATAPLWVKEKSSFGSYGVVAKRK